MKAYFSLLCCLLLSFSTYAQIAYTYDANGNRVRRIPPPPDVTVILYQTGAPVHPGVTFTLVARVFELPSVPTPGIVSLYLSKDTYIVNLSFNPTATFLGGRPVSNANWTFDNTNDDYYILTSNVPIAADASLSVGFTATTIGGQDQDKFFFVATVAPVDGEVNLSNNQSFIQIPYFAY